MFFDETINDVNVWVQLSDTMRMKKGRSMTATMVEMKKMDDDQTDGQRSTTNQIGVGRPRDKHTCRGSGKPP